MHTPSAWEGGSAEVTAGLHAAANDVPKPSRIPLPLWPCRRRSVVVLERSQMCLRRWVEPPRRRGLRKTLAARDVDAAGTATPVPYLAVLPTRSSAFFRVARSRPGRSWDGGNSQVHEMPGSHKSGTGAVAAAQTPLVSRAQSREKNTSCSPPFQCVRYVSLPQTDELALQCIENAATDQGRTPVRQGMR
jgi:hypothetical protein